MKTFALGTKDWKQRQATRDAPTPRGRRPSRCRRSRTVGCSTSSNSRRPLRHAEQECHYGAGSTQLSGIAVPSAAPRRFKWVDLRPRHRGDLAATRALSQSRPGRRLQEPQVPARILLHVLNMRQPIFPSLIASVGKGRRKNQRPGMSIPGPKVTHSEQRRATSADFEHCADNKQASPQSCEHSREFLAYPPHRRGRACERRLRAPARHHPAVFGPSSGKAPSWPNSLSRHEF
jgi:hypothetical protein